MTNEELLKRLRELTTAIKQDDKEIAEEVDEAMDGLESGRQRTLEERIDEETIVLRRLRPVFAIHKDAVKVEFREKEDSELWKRRMKAAKSVLAKAIPAVGRVETGDPERPWVGTGWLVDDDVLVTNRHVADGFTEAGDVGRVYLRSATAPGVDFLQELDRSEQRVFRLKQILHVEPEGGPDLAFFRVDPAGTTTLAQPITLSASPLEKGSEIGVIGYPASDRRIPDQALMRRIYGGKYDKKRFAPGILTKIENTRILHDCTTLGGNSGSVVLDLKTGEAVGLHFSGKFEVSNYAVRADAVARRLDELRKGALRSQVSVRRPERAPAAPPANTVARVDAPALVLQPTTATFTLPLTISVTLGVPTLVAPAPTAARVQPVRSPAPAEDDGSDDDDVSDNEAVVADYADRNGYQPDFLGVDIALPTVDRGKRDVLKFTIDGEEEFELRYRNFSVVMSKSRRMCLFSAVNIDGATSKKTKRKQWRLDPRIPAAQQIKHECYGKPPRFSRGHMTRREDPAWGTHAQAQRGSDDSMHVTNAVPQRQAFNSPIWLGLEDYALQHARDDKMQIAVFTGPYLTKGDPVCYGVQVPVRFWKIIAFIHDETGELCATGYEMTDDGVEANDDEFVYGQFVSPQLQTTTQVAIAAIERRSGLSFAGLADYDALLDQEESVQRPASLRSFAEIRLRR